MSRPKLGKNKLGNFLVVFLIFLMVTVWIFSGWPRVWEKPPFPSEIEKAKASPDQETRRPNADGHTTNWTISDTTHYGATSDQSDSTYVYSSTDNVYEFLNVQDPTFPDGTTVNWIQTYYRCQCSGTCDKGPEKIDLYISDGTTDSETDGNVAVSRTGFADIVGAQQTVNPVDSQAWEYQDIVDLQIGMMTDTTGGDQIQCSELWVVVDYTSAPTLSFSISDNTIGFDALSTTAPVWATGDTNGSASETSAHTLSASTNATNGYSITVKGDTLKDNGNSITAIGGTAQDVSAGGGTEQFGIRLTASGGSGAAVAPYNGAANMYAYAADASTEDEVASAAGTDSGTTYSVYYAANIAATTEAGSYNTALTYICTGNF